MRHNGAQYVAWVLRNQKQPKEVSALWCCHCPPFPNTLFADMHTGQKMRDDGTHATWKWKHTPMVSVPNHPIDIALTPVCTAGTMVHLGEQRTTVPMPHTWHGCRGRNRNMHQWWVSSTTPSPFHLLLMSVCTLGTVQDSSKHTSVTHFRVPMRISNSWN